MAAGGLRRAALGLSDKLRGRPKMNETGPKVFLVYSFWNTNSEMGSN